MSLQQGSKISGPAGEDNVLPVGHRTGLTGPAVPAVGILMFGWMLRVAPGALEKAEIGVEFNPPRLAREVVKSGEAD